MNRTGIEEKFLKKRDYSSPELKVFGLISKLTASGSGLNFEAFAQGMCDEATTKQINPMCA